jgi:hypothetical protein
MSGRFLIEGSGGLTEENIVGYFSPGLLKSLNCSYRHLELWKFKSRSAPCRLQFKIIVGQQIQYSNSVLSLILLRWVLSTSLPYLHFPSSSPHANPGPGHSR